MISYIHLIIEGGLLLMILASWGKHLKTAKLIDDIERELTFRAQLMQHVSAPACDPRTGK